MSMSYEPIEPVCVLDPIVAVNNKRSYAVLKSGSQTTYKAYTTTSVSNSSIQFSCNPPSASVYTDRKISLTLPIRVSYSGIPQPGKPLLRGLYDAPRAFPLANIIDTLSITLNNYSTSINIADVVQALMRYNTDDDLKMFDYSTTPTYQDQFQEYTFGAIRNELGFYVDSGEGSQIPRGGFPFKIVHNPVQAEGGTAVLTSIVDIVVTENLFLSPLYFGHGNECGFFNLSTFDANFTLVGGSANRFWSHNIADGGASFLTSKLEIINAQTVTPVFSYAQTQAQMLFKYITPLETQILPLNMPITYPYFDVVRYATDSSTVAAYGTSGLDKVTLNSNNIQLSSIPRRVYIYIRRRNTDLQNSAEHTDTFFQISGLSIQFSNKNGLLASASMEQLYQMSVKNHCKMSWQQWSGGPVILDATWTGGLPSYVGTCGAVVAIEFATDLGLDSISAPGKLEQCQFSVQVKARNMSAGEVTPTMHVVVVSEGTFVIQSRGQASSYIGVISSKDILECQQRPWISYSDLERVNGGDFWSGLETLKNWVSKAHDFVKDNKLISKGLSIIPQTQWAAPIASQFGYGEGGVLLGASENGGVMLGGKSMPRKKLQSRVNKYN